MEMKLRNTYKHPGRLALMTREIANSFFKMFINKWQAHSEAALMETIVKLTNGLCLGEGHFFCLFLSEDNALGERRGKRGKDKLKKKRKKNYFRLQAAADVEALANTSALHILKIWTRNASDHWSAIFLIPALLFPYESVFCPSGFDLIATVHISLLYFPLPIPLLIECPVKLQSYIFNSATHLPCKNRV